MKKEKEGRSRAPGLHLTWVSLSVRARQPCIPSHPTGVTGILSIIPGDHKAMNSAEVMWQSPAWLSQVQIKDPTILPFHEVSPPSKTL